MTAVSSIRFQHTNRYVCDSHGTPICLPGWREPASGGPLQQLNPCLEPICDSGGGVGCVHGECRAPHYCACEVGW
jgi:hypothetical protein